MSAVAVVVVIAGTAEPLGFGDADYNHVRPGVDDRGTPPSLGAVVIAEPGADPGVLQAGD